MSEIFNWLKRAETEKHRDGAEGAVMPVRLRPDLRDASARTAVEPEEDASQAAVADLETSSDATFDLAEADYRVKTVLDPFTPVGEQYRFLRARLTLVQRERGLKSLLVTSSIAEEGKTFTACSLAGVLAQEPGRRVLLIDADLRKPKADQNLGLAGSAEIKGLVHILREETKAEDTLIRSTNLNLFFMPAGPSPQNPAELLSSPVLEQTIRKMSAYFDWVVLDSPPVLALADASLIAQVCDGTILVVRTDKTLVKYVKETIQRLGKERICGILLNRGRYRSRSRYYYRYYRQYAKK